MSSASDGIVGLATRSASAILRAGPRRAVRRSGFGLRTGNARRVPWNSALAADALMGDVIAGEIEKAN